MDRINDEKDMNTKEYDALYAELQNEAASLDTIHEMLGSYGQNC